MLGAWGYLSTQPSSPLQLDLYRNLQIARLVVVMEEVEIEGHSTRSLDMRKVGEKDCRDTENSSLAPVLGQSCREGTIDGIALGKLWAGMQSLDLRLFSVVAERGVAVSKRSDIDVERRHWRGAERTAVGAASPDVLEPYSPKDNLENRIEGS